MSTRSPVLYIVRGLPGSGKSTIASTFGVEVAEADQFFVNAETGLYEFDVSQLAAAHNFCQVKALNALAAGKSVAVANTFTQAWEMAPYLEMADKLNVRFVVVDVFDSGMTDQELAGKNEHDVSDRIIHNMRMRWEHDWRKGDLRPPWERNSREFRSWKLPKV